MVGGELLRATRVANLWHTGAHVSEPHFPRRVVSINEMLIVIGSDDSFLHVMTYLGELGYINAGSCEVIT